MPTITGVSVIYYDAAGDPHEIGTQDQNTIDAGTDKICQDFLKRLALHKKFNESKRQHRFTTNQAGAIISPVHHHLIDLQHGRNMQVAANAVAQHFATWRWMRHYVLLFISYQLNNEDLLALVMSASASEDTFSFSVRHLVTELERVFKRAVDKAVQFPLFTPGRPGAIPDPSQVVVIQLNSQAEYLPQALDLDAAPTLLEVMAPRVQTALNNGYRGRQIVRAVSEILEEERRQGTAPVGQHDPVEMPVQVEMAGITIRATMADLHSGRVQVNQEGNRWQITLTDTTDNIKVTIGRTPAHITDLVEPEAAD